MDRIIWYCPCDDDIEYDEPGVCPLCGAGLEQECIEDQSYLYATSFDCDDDPYGDGTEPPRY